MGKTFGDYLRENGGKEPEKVVPADDCKVTIETVIDAFAKPHWRCESPDHNEDTGCSNPECFKHDPAPPEWEEYVKEADKLWDKIIGDEAELARCENCQIDMLRDRGVECSGCGGFFGKHGKGRNGCWTNHNCGKLVTAAGALVKMGDILVYPSHADEFLVIRMEGTWAKGGHARGLRRRGDHEMPIIPRLMYHKETSK